jgi:tetratricopeptide (TPR) repeat protein
MGRSIQERPTVSPATFFHRLSNRHYSITPQSMRRHQLDAQGREVNVVEKPISLAIGSGNHAITYASRTPRGLLLELPLSWYRKLNGFAMSPGYDSPAHQDFRREISASCLFCHSNSATPAPIDCQRCHGDAIAHAARPSKSNIHNPRRNVEVCLQCHLETTSRGIPDSMRQSGREAFSYRPGEPLVRYKLYFDRADTQSTDRFEINHAGFRLLQSRCFTESKGGLTCISCHDPHSARVRARACQQCHNSPHVRDASSDCASCHMPKRTASDAIHTTMTDHKIQRVPRFINPTREDQVPYAGPVVPFFTKADALSLAIVNIRDANEESVQLYRRHLLRAPGDEAARISLAKMLLRLNRASEVAPILARAVTADALQTLAVSYAVQGHHQRAKELLERALLRNPDHTLSWINLGITLDAMKDQVKALAAFEEAVRLQPDSSEARQYVQHLRQRQ